MAQPRGFGEGPRRRPQLDQTPPDAADDVGALVGPQCRRRWRRLPIRAGWQEIEIAAGLPDSDDFGAEPLDRARFRRQIACLRASSDVKSAPWPRSPKIALKTRSVINVGETLECNSFNSFGTWTIIP